MMRLEKHQLSTSVGKVLIRTRMLWILLAAIAVAVFTIFVLYKLTENLLKERLQSKMIAIVNTAAVSFDPADIREIRAPDDTAKESFRTLVSQLATIRGANNTIRYAYLMRKTDNPNIFEFIADADTLATDDELDENNSGVVDEEEMPPQPGDPYPVGDYPVLRDEAFSHPSVDRDLQPDQWGLMMAAYAPIRDEDGVAIAIIGMDILVNDFQARTQEALLPFLLFTLFFIFLIVLLTILLTRIWNEKVEALKEIDRQKDELLSIVSHQLATPITSVRWYIEMMMAGDIGVVTKEQKKHLQTVYGTVINLVDLVHVILDVSRMQLGRMKTKPQDLDLESFLREIVDVISAKAKEKGVRFTINVPSTLPHAFLDKRLTHMTIENILSNAVKYTPKGGSVSFSVSCDTSHLHVKVEDTGCGIPPHDQDKIFEKLFRASNTGDIEGNGFGLFVAKGAIEAQGGKIYFRSKLNLGTILSVDLPLQAVLQKQDLGFSG